MAIYSLAITTNSWTLNRPILEIRTTATDRARLLEIGLSGGSYGARFTALGRPGNIGVGPSSPVTALAENPSDPAGTVTCAINWTTEPSRPPYFFRSFNAADDASFNAFWSFPKGLVIPVSSSLVLWNFSATSGLYVWIVVEE